MDSEIESTGGKGGREESVQWKEREMILKKSVSERESLVVQTQTTPAEKNEHEEKAWNKNLTRVKWCVCSNQIRLNTIHSKWQAFHQKYIYSTYLFPGERETERIVLLLL